MRGADGMGGRFGDDEDMDGAEEAARKNVEGMVHGRVRLGMRVGARHERTREACMNDSLAAMAGGDDW